MRKRGLTLFIHSWEFNKAIAIVDVDVDDGSSGVRPKQLGNQHNKKILGPICMRPLHFAVFIVCACKDVT